jgi:hypothetical protein
MGDPGLEEIVPVAEGSPASDPDREPPPEPAVMEHPLD